MKNEWFAAKELIGIAGLPSSPQGINQMARREGWVSRRRKGVQGKAVEYHIDSLPLSARNLLILQEEPASYQVERNDSLVVLIECFRRMTESERERLLTFLMREGIGSLLARISDEATADAMTGPDSEPEKR
ncbi:DNA-binding protein [Serratia odorifera]|uniref:DNA-binding protein n=1 Tax=Serratia odorifera TaxID=618 RepID=UPI0018E8DFF7|nr:DNA-binding protein [Serratia odorifera]MBJ2067346.1 putative DNA-binding transcriptional regulator [Serratia odorifera]